MLTEIIDSVAVVNASVLFYLIVSPETVFHYHERNTVSVVDFIKSKSESLRVDLPSPVGSFKIRILKSGNEVSVRFLILGICTDAVCHVVAEGIEVNGSGL